MSWNDRKIRPSTGFSAGIPKDGVEVRAKNGGLAGWQESVPTLGGVSTTHVWATCIMCGRRMMMERAKLVRELAAHRASRFGSKADACGGPLLHWLLMSDRPKEIARERGFDWITKLEWHPPMRLPNGDDENFALTFPFRTVFGDAWRARFWYVNLAQIDADYARAIAAISEGGIMEAQ